ncbi:MAG TPA: hypothetical protein VGH53_32730 [Streptosporangiaceae bacterium]|jgi:hypothetical protein
MVKYSGRKKAARANGVSYTAAARRTNHRRGLLRALAVHTGVMLALEAAGWPAEYETFPEDVQHSGYAGPARLTVGRADQVRNSTGDDPDPETATCWTYLGRSVDMASATCWWSRPAQPRCRCPACAFDGEVFDIDDYAAASLASRSTG